jgi:hypothetical protein
MDATISTKLRTIGERVVSGEITVEAAAGLLRMIADRNPIVLPSIDPARDDLAHWRGLDLLKLRNENNADAWNLAAGLHVARERTQAGAGNATLDDAYAAQFSYRARAVQP